MVFGAISAIRTSGEISAFRADGVGSGSVTVGDGGGVIRGDGSGPVVVITNVSMVTDFGSTGGDAGDEEDYLRNRCLKIDNRFYAALTGPSRQKAYTIPRP